MFKGVTFNFSNRHHYILRILEAKNADKHGPKSVPLAKNFSIYLFIYLLFFFFFFEKENL